MVSGGAGASGGGRRGCVAGFGNSRRAGKGALLATRAHSALVGPWTPAGKPEAGAAGEGAAVRGEGSSVGTHPPPLAQVDRRTGAPARAEMVSKAPGSRHKWGTCRP